MSKIESVALLKFKNKHLQEDMVHYKAENVYLWAQIHELKDEKRALEEKLNSFITAINNIGKKCRIESYLPKELLNQIKEN